MIGLVTAIEFLFLPPVCLAIALVTSAAHREHIPTILRTALRSWIVLLVGIVAFMIAVSYLFEWILP